MDDDKARLLDILECNGRSFLNLFPDYSIARGKNIVAEITGQKDLDEDDENWSGIDHSDDEKFIAKNETEVVVFSSTDPLSNKKTLDYVSKVEQRRFMSSKVLKLCSNPKDSSPKKGSPDDESERSHSQNDALLQEMIHAKILSGDFDLPPTKRRKALAGRVLELAGDAKVGEGEKLIHDAERNKAAKRIREGLTRKKKERSEQELETAKNVGMYHPTLKKYFDASSSSTSKRKRERGLKMGVGRYNNGSLKLRTEEVSMAVGNPRDNRLKFKK